MTAPARPPDAATAPATDGRTLADLVDEVDGRAACLSLSRDPNAKLTVLLFRPGQDAPAYVAKVPTTDVAARMVVREADRLAAVATRDLGSLRPTVPRLVSMVEHRGLPVLVMTAVPGRSMLAGYHGWRHTARPTAVGADFAAAGEWLAGLHRATADGGTHLAAGLDEARAAIRARFGQRPGVATALAGVDDVAARLGRHQVPSAVTHGDFWLGNLLVDGGRVVGVVDWEAARAGGSPVADAARFAVTYSLYLDRHTRSGRRVAGHPGLRAGRWGAGVEYALAGTGWYPDLVRSFLAAALGRLGAPATCWRDVLLADLATIAAGADHAEFAWRHLSLFLRAHRGDRR